MRKSLSAAFLSLMFLSVFSMAQAKPDANNNYDVYSYGGHPCSTWTAYRAAGTADPFEAWLLGYLTAYNVYGPGVHNIGLGTTAEEREARIDAICAKHPQAGIVQAIDALIDELAAKRAPAKPAATPAKPASPAAKP